MKIRRKPLVLDAHPFDGTEKSVAEARLLLEHTRGPSKITFTKPNDGGEGWVTVVTNNGAVNVKKGEYIVRGPKGELYPIQADILAETYDILPDK